MIKYPATPQIIFIWFTLRRYERRKNVENGVVRGS